MVKSNSFVLISTFKHALVVFDNKKMVGPPPFLSLYINMKTRKIRMPLSFCVDNIFRTKYAINKW